MKEYTNEQMSALIDSHIHNKRDRDLLKRRLVDGIVYEQLASEFELSTQRVKAIVYKSMQKLIKYL